MTAFSILVRLPVLLVMLQALSNVEPALSIRALRLTAIDDLSSMYWTSASDQRAAPQLAEQTSPSTTGNSGLPESHIRVVEPAAAPQQWSWHDRVVWAATLILVALGYWILFVQHRMLRRLEEQTHFLQEVAQTAESSAHSVQDVTKLLMYQSRPWMIVSIERLNTAENSFRIVATNRGRCPAEIISLQDRIGVVRSESFLPKEPEYIKEAATPPAETVIYPNHSIVLQIFKQDDLRWICSTQELFRSVQQGIDKIFLYGRVSYTEKACSTSAAPYETNWCASYSMRGTVGTLVPFGPSRYRECQ